MKNMQRILIDEEPAEIELDPGFQRLAVAIIMRALNDLGTKEFSEDAKAFLTGNYWLFHWLAVLEIDIEPKVAVFEKMPADASGLSWLAKHFQGRRQSVPSPAALKQTNEV